MIDVQKPKAGTSGRGSSEVAADRAKDLGQDLKSQASGLADTVSQVVKDQASSLSSAAKEMAGDATDMAEKLKALERENRELPDAPPHGRCTIMDPL